MAKTIMYLNDLTKKKELSIYKAYLLDKRTQGTSDEPLPIDPGLDRYASTSEGAIEIAIRDLYDAHPDSITMQDIINNRISPDINIVIAEFRFKLNDRLIPLYVDHNGDICNPLYNGNKQFFNMSLNDKEYKMFVHEFRITSTDIVMNDNGFISSMRIQGTLDGSLASMDSKSALYDINIHGDGPLPTLDEDTSDDTTEDDYESEDIDD